ncbi:heme/copper-type cytochrome/quinol oxidase subunit 2 [Bradyrhizobium sp. LB13.1]
MNAEQTHSNGSASAEVAARVERRWTIVAVIIIVMMALLAAFAGIHRATMPQPRVETTDPSRLHLSGEFVESNLGSVLEANGNVTVRAIGQQYSFTPACILVPVDTPITLRATSADVVHGILIQGTKRQHHAGAGLHLRAAHALYQGRRLSDALPGILLLRPRGHVGQGQGDRQDRIR